MRLADASDVLDPAQPGGQILDGSEARGQVLDRLDEACVADRGRDAVAEALGEPNLLLVPRVRPLVIEDEVADRLMAEHRRDHADALHPELRVDAPDLPRKRMLARVAIDQRRPGPEGPHRVLVEPARDLGRALSKLGRHVPASRELEGAARGPDPRATVPRG